MSSSLGCLLSGTISGDTPSSTPFFSMHVCNNCDLDQTLQKFWLQEELPKSNPLTAEEQKCEDHYKNTHSQNAEGRYVLRLPFKNGRPSSSLHLGA